MKKYALSIILYTVASAGSLYAEHTLEDKLLAAIKECDEKKVTLLLIDTEELDKESSKRLLEAADHLIKRCKKSISVWKSRGDLLTFGGGLVATYLAGMSFVVTFISQFYSDNVIRWYYKDGVKSLPAEQIKALAPSLLGVGLVSSAVACYLLKKGWKCQSAVHSHENALEIKNLIEKASLPNVTS